MRARSSAARQQTWYGQVLVAVLGQLHCLVVAVPVSEGQEVKAGDVLLILESMKMQNELKSPRDGVVKSIHVGPGASVEQRQKMLSVE